MGLVRWPFNAFATKQSAKVIPLISRIRVLGLMKEVSLTNVTAPPANPSALDHPGQPHRNVEEEMNLLEAEIQEDPREVMMMETPPLREEVMTKKMTLSLLPTGKKISKKPAFFDPTPDLARGRERLKEKAPPDKLRLDIRQGLIVPGMVTWANWIHTGIKELDVLLSI
jgi:hypothetical protein